MPLIVDGYNLLFAANVVVQDPGTYTLQKSRAALLRFVAALVPPADHGTTTVVFDGREAPPGLASQELFGKLTVRYSARGTEADDLIEELVKACTTPRTLVVVSSDHRVQRAAQRRGATAIDSEQWTRQQRLRQQEDHPQPRDEGAALYPELEDEEIAQWVDRFSDEDQP